MDYVQNQSYSEPDNGGGFVKFLLGFLTGVGITAPITALIVKKICDRQKEDAIIDAENRGMQAMAQVSVQEYQNISRGALTANSGANTGIYTQSSTYSEQNQKESVNSDHNQPDEAYLASLQSPTDDDGLDYDIENYNVTIDDEEATQEASEFSESHVRYLDMVEKYKNSGGDIRPMTISREQFDNEHFFEKCYINWYEDDDIFEEDDCKIEDPLYSFGFSSGREMFSPKLTELREDRDICHIRNLKLSTDFEITRVHGSYTKLVRDGEAYYHGEANSQY